MLLATTRKGAYNDTKMQRQVSGMHIAHGFMHRRNQDFALGGQIANHMQRRHEKFSRGTFYWRKNKRSEAEGLVWYGSRILLKGKD